MGSEYCPFCAAQRWAMVNAFSRFGTFTGLTTTHSSSTDTDPNTPTLTFYGSTYTSNYISLVTVELEHNYRIGNSTSTSVAYAPLQTPTAAEEKLQTAYDPGTYIPFIDFGNKYAQVGNLSPLTPTMLDGLTWQQVATDMSNPSSSVGAGRASPTRTTRPRRSARSPTTSPPPRARRRSRSSKAPSPSSRADSNGRRPAMASSKARSRNRSASGKGGRPAAGAGSNGKSPSSRTVRGCLCHAHESAEVGRRYRGPLAQADRGSARAGGGVPAGREPGRPAALAADHLAGAGRDRPRRSPPTRRTRTTTATTCSAARPGAAARSTARRSSPARSRWSSTCFPVAVLGLAFYVFAVVIFSPWAWRFPIARSAWAVGRSRHQPRRRHRPAGVRDRGHGLRDVPDLRRVPDRIGLRVLQRASTSSRSCCSASPLSAPPSGDSASGIAPPPAPDRPAGVSARRCPVIAAAMTIEAAIA